MSTTSQRTIGMATKTTDSSGPARKLLSFGLGNEEYGLDILAVREIIGLIDVTPLPRTPPHVKGVINLRGQIIPVIELRARFGMPSVRYTDDTCIIVIEIPAEGEADPRVMGVVVDAVREVLDIPTSAIELPPAFACGLPMDCVTGIGKVKERVVVMLDPAAVVQPPGTPNSLADSGTRAAPSATGA